MNPSDFIAGYKRAIDEKIDGELDALPEPETLYEPVKYVLRSGGKRLRPVLLMSSCHWIGGTVEEALEAAWAVELFHNFTLVHDDIMDRASLRRGEEPVYKRYGLNTALLAGDVMHALAHRAVGKAAVSCGRMEILHLFDDMTVAVCEGQQLDSDAEQKAEISVTDYLEIIGRKTAALLGSCFQIGGLIGGANTVEGELLHRYGLMTGMAFQIQDDYLDVFGESDQTGKEKGGDILRNKKTYLYLKALQEAGASDRKILLELFDPGNRSVREDKVNRVIDIYKKYGVDEAANSLKNAYRDRALACLEDLSGNSRSVDLLKVLGDALIYRSY